MQLAFGIGGKSFDPMIRYWLHPLNLLWILVAACVLVTLIVLFCMAAQASKRTDGLPGAMRYIRVIKTVCICGLLGVAFVVPYGIGLMFWAIAKAGGTPDPGAMADAITIKTFPLLVVGPIAVIGYVVAAILQHRIEGRMAKDGGQGEDGA